MSPIVVFSANGNGDPSVRTRITEWCAWTQRDSELRVGGLLGPTRRAATQQTVVVARYAYKCSTGSFEARVLRDAALGVYDLDDGLPWDDGRLPDLGAWWKQPFRRDRIALRSAMSASRVVAGNELLAEWAAQHCNDVRLIPTCVNVAEYERKVEYEIGDEPRVLWIGSSATESELDLVSDALIEVHRRTNCRLTILGSPGRRTSPKLLPFTTRIPWSLENQRSQIALFDLGIMPLRDGQYQRAKCGYTLLQYAAAGLPAVCSPVGVNERLARDGVAIGAQGLDQWIEVLTDLIGTTSAARRAIGNKAHRVVATQFTYDVWADRWNEALT